MSIAGLAFFDGVAVAKYEIFPYRALDLATDGFREFRVVMGLKLPWYYRRVADRTPPSAPHKTPAGLNLVSRIASERKLAAEILRPNTGEQLNNLAWIRAAHDDDALRSPDTPIRLAERAAELTGGGNAYVLDTLATAYAAAGRFDAAVATATRALSRIPAPLVGDLSPGIQQRLTLFRSGTPYREPAVVTASPP